MPPLFLSDEEVQQLRGIANSRSLPHSIVQRAQIVLACGAGETNTAISNRMGLMGTTVGKWRKRYRDLGLEGLYDELGPGRPRTYEDDKVTEVINRALVAMARCDRRAGLIPAAASRTPGPVAGWLPDRRARPAAGSALLPSQTGASGGAMHDRQASAPARRRGAGAGRAIRQPPVARARGGMQGQHSVRGSPRPRAQRLTPARVRCGLFHSTASLPWSRSLPPSLWKWL
ncbi:MAG: helix-turn-helix domain-containing protein [Synechococcus sp.]|nr:helix-turn-helix domain-containing protein [Synechococcus sp.]